MMDYVALICFLVFLAAVYPLLVILLYPVSIILWICVILPHSKDQVMADIKQNGHMVIAKYEHQHRMRHKPASGNDISTLYCYEYMGKKYKYVMWTSYLNVPVELPLYFYKNPRRASPEGSAGVQKTPLIRLFLLTAALVLAGCILVTFLFVSSPGMMNSFMEFFKELMEGHIVL